MREWKNNKSGTCHPEPAKWKNPFIINEMTSKIFAVGVRFIARAPVKLQMSKMESEANRGIILYFDHPQLLTKSKRMQTMTQNFEL